MVCVWHANWFWVTHKDRDQKLHVINYKSSNKQRIDYSKYSKKILVYNVTGDALT